jgi:two-component sensor histidine kinase
VNTATRFHAGDRARDLTTTATALHRRKGVRDLRLESAAWRDLSRALAADPSQALSCALDLARNLCHAGTAGLSLFKPDAANLPVVRWELVRGELAHHQGLDTPVRSSPCGLCLEAGATILVSRPVRAFAWLEDTRPSILEELIAPLQDSTGRMAGTLWIAHHDERSRCSADDVRIMEQLAHQIVLALQLREDERTRRQRAQAVEDEAQRALMFKQAMIDEVNHRAKNTLQAASSLLSLQARSAASAEVRNALLDTCGRLQLLADVHALIAPARDQSQTVLMPRLLQTLCDALRSLFGNTYHDVSLELAADPITLPVDDAIAIALFSNEAVTNAYKHAFADQPAGKITVRLHRPSEHVWVLRIADSGVGADLAHVKGGMGLTLMRTLATQLRGTLELEGHAGSPGTRVTLTMQRQSAAQRAS